VRNAYRAADIRAAEEAFIATLPDGTLMQRAASGLARRAALLLQDRFGGVAGRRVLLLVGAGNNGGDALYAGARLASRGARVSAVLLNEQPHAGGLAALTAAGGMLDMSGMADLVIDGLLGTGAHGGLREPAAALVASMDGVEATDGGRPVMVAVDLPSGIDVDTGAVPGEAVRADVTVTFGVLKPGLVVGRGAVRSGHVEVVDIGLVPWLRAEPVVRVPDNDDVRGWWPYPGPGDDKYTRGVVGLATGSGTYPGAAVLSVAGALAGPTGLVRYAGRAADAVRTHHPSVISVDQVADAGRVQAWVCGSGLGTDEFALGEVRAVLAADVPVCLDADALSLVASHDLVRELTARAKPTVVTPHDREFARLAGAEPGDDRVGDALKLAARLGITVLLKGDRTIVATPDGRAYANPTGTADLATGGTGDVLAGLLGSLLAGGLPPERAALAAAYVHGLAGRIAAEAGPVTATMVADALRAAVRVVH
jgi:hydroxyethylthiazole kinase-like uncharacterized protein yjeF